MHSHKEAAAASAPVAEQAPPLDVRCNENALAAGVESKRKRGKSYDDRQMAIMVAAIRNGSGYKQILKENKDAGFTLYGLKDAVKRLKANDVDPARKQGSGRKASVAGRPDEGEDAPGDQYACGAETGSMRPVEEADGQWIRARPAQDLLHGREGILSGSIAWR